jgi:aspartyl-tRNA(Asn)/glutamyl-tRNA(Gln) amidotransferase subunit A
MQHKMSIATAKQMLTEGKISSQELLQQCLQIANKNQNNSFVQINEDQATKLAEQSQQRIQSGTALPLDGMPSAIKDNYCTKGIKTTACSNILKDFVPPYDSTVTNLLQTSGSIMVGKTNMDEFAMGSATINSIFGATINPHKDATNPNKKLVSGGSSGGSAVAVAEGAALFAMGSDTGGSVRQPAAFCGIVGTKPSYGMCSRYGMISYASSLDQAGVFTNTVEDAATVLDVIAKYDESDSTSIPTNLRKFTSFGQNLNKGVKGLKIGIPKQYNIDGIFADIKQSWDSTAKILESQGAEIVPIDLPHTEYAIMVYYVISTAEASSNLARYDGIKYGYKSPNTIDLDSIYRLSRSEGFGIEVKRRIMLGTFVLASENYDAHYLKAMKVRSLIKKDFSDAFQTVDAILCPTTPNCAFGLDEKINDPVLMYLNDVFTVPVNLAGLPGISVPTALSQTAQLPIGMQVITNHGNDHIMLQIANTIEKCINL